MTDPNAGPASPPRAAWGVRERLLVGSNVALMVVVAVAIYLGVNFVSFHQYKQLDWTSSKANTVSPDTVSLLTGLDKDIQVIRLVAFEATRPTDAEVIPLVDNLLERYASISEHVKVEKIDFDTHRERAKLVYGQYNLTSPNVVVFSVGDKKKVVSLSDTAEVEYGGGSPYGGGAPDRLRAFKGEEAFSSAIREVTEEKRTTVYFLEGHGEISIDEFKPEGLSELAKRLKRDNYKVESLNLLVPKEGREKGVPSDCDVLAIVQPTKDASGDEVEAVRQWVGKGGKLLLLADPLKESNLFSVVKDYGVTLDPAPRVLIDLAENRHNPFADPMALVASDNFTFDHDVTKAFREKGVCMFNGVRPLTIGASEAGGAVTKLVSTSPDQSAGKLIVDGRLDPRASPDDLKGPLCYGAAVEKPGAGGGAPTRIVVFGDADFALNGSPYTAEFGIGVGYNEDLLSNSFDWLAEKEAYFDIAPKSTEERRITLTGEVETRVFYFAILGMPILLGLVLGGAVWFVRRR